MAYMHIIIPDVVGGPTQEVVVQWPTVVQYCTVVEWPTAVRYYTLYCRTVSEYPIHRHESTTQARPDILSIDTNQQPRQDLSTRQDPVNHQTCKRTKQPSESQTCKRHTILILSSASKGTEHASGKHFFAPSIARITQNWADRHNVLKDRNDMRNTMHDL